MIELEDISLILPEIVLAAAAVLVMLSIAVKRSHTISYLLTLAGIIISFITLLNIETVQALATPLFVIDGLGKILSGLILMAALLITLFAYPYFKNTGEKKEEFYILFLLATLGAVCMVISHHFIAFVLSLEVLSVSLFSMIGYLRHEKFSIEAGIKYLIMAAVATSFILFGFALLYTATGSMDLQYTGAALRENDFNPLVLAGLAMVMVGFGFKMALVPFHLWTPDIYAGAPAPVSAFVATVSKGAAFVFLLRLFYSTGGLLHASVWMAFAVIACASMLIGNWLALRQHNVKRLLAYSSISHLGYLMVAFLTFSEPGIRSASFYLIAYFASMLAAFGGIAYLTGEKGEPLLLDDFNGMAYRRPWITALFTLVMLSLAGIPLTAGFLGKFYIIGTGMDATGMLFLLIILVVSSTIGLFYYLKVVAAMFSKEGAAAESRVVGDASFVMKLSLLILFVLIIWLGVYPSPVLDLLGMIGAGN